MPPELLAALHSAFVGITPLELGLRLCSALLLSTLLALFYRFTAGPAYNADNARAQILLACIMAMVMVVVGDSVSRAFGAVGILGVIRFRSNVSNSAEAATLLAGVAVGMACGVGMFIVAAIGAAFLGIVQIGLQIGFGGAPVPEAQGKQKKKKKDKKKSQEPLEPEAAGEAVA